MEDITLNLNLEESKELHALWGQYREFSTLALKGEKIAPQAEMKFLELKTRIAILHDGFMDSVKHDHKVGQKVMEVLANCISLRRIQMMSNADVQKLDFDWNESYMLITETIQGLEKDREKLRTTNKFAHQMRQIKGQTAASIHNFFVGPYFKALAGLGVIMFVFFGIPAFGIYDFMELKKQFPVIGPVYDRAAALVRYFNSELVYMELADVKIEEDLGGQFRHGQRQRDNANVPIEVQAQRFVSQLISIGFSAGDFEEVSRLYENRKHYEREIVDVAVRGRVFIIVDYILFENSGSARRFVELGLQGRSTLNLADQDRITLTSTICRKANFVILLTTPMPSPDTQSRIDFAKNKWLLEDAEIFS